MSTEATQSDTGTTAELFTLRHLSTGDRQAHSTAVALTSEIIADSKFSWYPKNDIVV